MNDVGQEADAIAMAKAFRGASDEDTMQVLNAQSSKKKSDLEKLVYYAIPESWMRKAWPILTGQALQVDQNWREQLGSIDTDRLIAWADSSQSATSSGEEDQDEQDDAEVQAQVHADADAVDLGIGRNHHHHHHRHDKKAAGHSKSSRTNTVESSADRPTENSDNTQRRLASSPSSSSRQQSPHSRQKTRTRCRPQPKPLLPHWMDHETDFFLLGPNAWLLLKLKFGCQHEIPLSCVFEQGHESSVAVIVPKAKHPKTGKPETALHIPIPGTGRFTYELLLDKPVAEYSKMTKNAVGLPAEPMSQPGNVSDDEAAEYGDDLVPGFDDDDRMSMEPHHVASKSEPILLLPPSSTISAPVPALNEMEYEKANGDCSASLDGADDDDIDRDQDNTDGSGHFVMETATFRRRYGSGLGNLGNTCFMNSTLQCLAHTNPLREYFLSGAYEQDLNRDNPLGTGGELATQFAQLLAEMWGITSSTNKDYGYQPATSFRAYNRDSLSTSNVVYPRNFKWILGKHAEQFVGYDQHDSQELATYLLDALHEDTNRVTRKPYIEKPEQGENESDEEAAEKAWQLHLKREDSRVLENFVGLVKSRVKCSEDGCGRVSTTFDPFMYLSVPIPGSTERTLDVTFVPLDPLETAKYISVTISKMATVTDLCQKAIEELQKASDGYVALTVDDVVAVEVWHKEVNKWLASDYCVDGIRDSDETFIYQLRPLAEIRKIEESLDADMEHGTCKTGSPSSSVKFSPPPAKRFKIDIATELRLNRGDEWLNELVKYLTNPAGCLNAFNQKKGSYEDRVGYYNTLLSFLEDLYKQQDESNATGQKRTREEIDDQALTVVTNPDDMTIPGIVDICQESSTFDHVESRFDVAVLECVAGKMHREILRMERDCKDKFPDGALIEVRMQRADSFPSTKGSSFVPPLVLRIPSNMTVYGLREEIAQRLARSFKIGVAPQQDSAFSSGQSTSENPQASKNILNGGDSLMMNVATRGMDPSFGSPEMIYLRQIPLTYERYTLYSSRTYSSGGRQLGSLEKPGGMYGSSMRSSVPLASKRNEDELVEVAQLVGSKAKISMCWSSDLVDRALDINEYTRRERLSSNGLDGEFDKQNGVKIITVQDCIEKYCQMEQLEESEMWYCNRCKKHVRAWKQFHLYQTPPILIIHLKRFQYSATSHRRDKIGVFIDFPLENLDLTQQVSSWIESEKPIYDCYAVSNHYGGLGGGHYTAYALNDDGEWCHYDDSRITTQADPRDVVSEAAYVLYYRRKDVSLSYEFPLNLQTQPEQAPAMVVEEKHADKDNDNSEVSSSVAMAGDDDNMDIDDVSIGSRVNSPAGSIEGTTGEVLFSEHPYDSGTGSGGMDHAMDSLPLQ